ncbi:ABC transporter ATP-binding protein [Actinocorallia sp. A-T 12471]|uniref:ABC transporter ATP-binding protein n=1 Tax=Actinocorallia sp. A-T 12471 TaxID=3089813 RepID=UPI0029D399A1|nr:ABC transporter ATP-binding protein [Actinocorallia sp. A-T 12471]MDX6740066.1 ABC transporter ATP-binding protein [Actinocorallia sp. A-T 12471]
MSDRRAARALLRGSVRGEWRALSTATLGGIARQGSLLALPWCIQHALDEGIVAGDSGATARWAGAALAFAVVQFLGLALWQFTARMAEARVGAVLRDRLTARLGLLDRAALSGYGHGDLAMRATRDVDQIRMWVYGLPVWAVIGTTFVIVLPAVAALDPLLLGVTLAMVPFIAAVNLVFPGPYERAGERLSDAHAARADTVEDLLSASAAVRGIGGEPVLVSRHHAHSAKVAELTGHVARIQSAWTALGPAAPRLAIAAGVGVGGFAALRGGLTPGGIVAFAVWMTTFTLAVTVLVDRLVDRGNATVAAGRLNEIFDLAPSVADPDAPRPLTEGGLAADGVVVEHDGRTVLGPVDLTVAPGEFVAVAGATGSGKSSLLRLLIRLDDPAAGTVKIGGIDLREASLDELRGRVAYVPQRPLVLSGTVARNLCPGREASAAELRAACEAACVHAEIMEMPDGYDTLLGEGGSTLSGGQVQRLALARALLTDADVLLLDDVTSALDPETEARVLAALRARTPRPSVVFVTHRDGVIEAADRVIRLGADDRDAATASGGTAWLK